MAVLTVQNLTRAGLAPTYASAAGGGDTFVDDKSGRTFIHAKNGSGGNLDVTVTSTAAPAANSGTAASSLTKTVVAGGEQMIGPFSPNFFDADGVVTLSYSGVTSLTIAAIKLGTP